jgi:uncharacterized protein YndB with AHSA1/START domain
MTVTEINKDSASLTMTMVSDWNAPLDRVWELWADPRKLERWWGPPMYPATVSEHDLRAGGRVSYYMTSPEGEQYHGWWKVVAVDVANRLELIDGFADADGNPNPGLPVTETTVTFAETAPGTTRMVIESRFPSKAAMEQLIEMGMEEGLAAAMGQIDAILGIE